jgi:mitochondrial transcription factor 1
VFPLGNVAVKERISIRNPHTAATLANAFIGEGSGKGRGKVVIEAFPGKHFVWSFRMLLGAFTDAIFHLFLFPFLGPGVLSRALLDLPKERIDKLIILEDHEPYLEKLRVRSILSAASVGVS